MEEAVIEFHLDSESGVSPYMQLVRQVKHALRLDLLREGDQLPTVKEVVAELAINPNTVLKAYRELEHEGLAVGRPGVGTFITRTSTAPPPEVQARLRSDLSRWAGRADAAGLDLETMVGMLRSVVNETSRGAVA